ncbi:MAG TPA: DUF4328 domain-containing protein [Asticcacaulis sp.]|nr:DUF4328 domain-containing protein [Asticcacaulis sp.]
MAEKPSDFRRPFILTRLLQATLALQVIATAAVAFVIAHTIETSSNLIIPPGIFEVYDLLRRSVGIWPLFNGILSLFWIYRVNKNTRAISAQALQFTPGWAVGWFFIPIANLVQPYLIVSELYNANQQSADWKALKRPWIVGLWWLMTICANILGGIVSVIAKDASAQPMELYFAFSVAMITHQVLALIIFSRIGNWQLAQRPGAAEAVF